MASSQVEIASSSPFACVLRDHNRRDRCNARAAFQKNLKELVRDHLHTRISISSPGAVEDENINSQPDNRGDCWGLNKPPYPRGLRFTTNNNNEGEESWSSEMSPRQSRILDRWAARQAQEMVSTIELEADAVPKNAALSPRESRVRGSEDIPNIGASSLVQMWEARLNRSNSLNALNNTCSSSAVCSSSRTNSGLSFSENATSEQQQEAASSCSSSSSSFSSSRGRASCNSPPPPPPPPLEDCLFGGDWESDHRTATGPSDPPSSRANSEAGERERVRVADIIKRLTLANCTQSTDDQEQTSTPKEREQQRGGSGSGSGIRERQQKSFPLIQTSSPRIRERSCALFDQAAEQQRERGHVLISSPKVRGRQAFNDLLMQMERNRQGELDALVERRPVSRFPQRRRLQSMLRLRCMQRGLAAQHQPSSSSLNRPQGSTITLLRERFNMGSEHDDPSGSGETNLRNRDIENKFQDLGNSSTVKNSVDSHRTTEEVDNKNMPQAPIQHEHVQPESYAFEDLHEEASLSSDVTWQETSFETSNIDTQETSNNGWDANTSRAEEEDVQDQQFLGINYDWFAEISRPRRYWEDRRQAWYQEMLDTDSHGEIRQLLERRRVSTFLSSEFRQRIDELMMSRLQRQEEETVHMENQQEEFMSFFRRHEHPAGGQEDVEEEDEEKGSSGCQYHEVGDYFDQTDSSKQPPLPSSIMSSWSSYQGGDDSGQIESTSNLHQPQPSQSYYHEETRQCSSSTNHPSIEMELIYGLRGHMEQLHHEMAQLRKSIESCMDMQVKLQHSIKQEVHSVQEEGKKSLNMKPRKGSCCICYEMQVNSLLYRCGHMCTCIKCAHELQWSSGKCPICRAPIVDVVRAYADS